MFPAAATSTCFVFLNYRNYYYFLKLLIQKIYFVRICRKLQCILLNEAQFPMHTYKSAYRITRYLINESTIVYHGDTVFLISSISHYGTRGQMDSLLGTLAPGVRVCTLDRIRPLDIFNESVCLNLSGYNVHPTCHLNQAVEAPYRILLVFIYLHMSYIYYNFTRSCIWNT